MKGHQIRRPTFLDALVFLLLMFLAVVPFEQILNLHVGVAIVNLGEILLLSIFFLFMVIVATRGLVLTYAPYVAFVFFVFFCYLAVSLTVVDTPRGQVIAQVRNYLPFIVACGALVTRLRIERNMFLRRLTIAIAISATLAILFHLLFQEIILNALSANEEMVMIIAEGGRMYWSSATLVFFALASLFLLGKGRVTLIVSVVIIIVGVLFTQSRSLLAGILLFVLLGQLLISRIKPSRIIGVMTLSVAAVGGFVWFASEQMVGLLLRRLLLSGDAQAELARSLTRGRLPLYEQYIRTFVDTFPIGQGLGRPLGFNYFLEIPVFTSDISVVSFVIPFGMFGLAILLGFVLVCRRAFVSFSRLYPDTRNSAVFLTILIVTLLVSFNFDLFSRNIFVVYMAVFSIIHHVPESRLRRGGISSMPSL